MRLQSYHRHNQGRIHGFQATTVVTPAASLGIGSMDATVARGAIGQPTITPRLQFSRRPLVVGATTVAIGAGSYIGCTVVPTTSAIAAQFLNSGGSGVDGTGDIIALGWDSTDTDETGLQELKCSLQTPRLFATRIDTNGTVLQGKKCIRSVVKGGTGVYTLTFNDGFGRNPVVALTGEGARFAAYTSKTQNTIVIQTYDVSGVAQDGRFHLAVLGQDGADEFGKLRNPVMSDYELHPVGFGVTAAGGTLNVGSADASGIVKNGTGDFTITFKKPFGKVPVACSRAVSQAKTSISSVTATAIRVLVTNAAGVAADTDFDVIVFGSPERGE
jgi:hypothetical protein